MLKRKYIRPFWDYRNRCPTKFGILILGIIAFLSVGVPPWQEAARAVDVNGIITEANQAANAARDTSSNIWSHIFDDPSPEYLVVVWMAGIIAATLLMVLAFQWISEASKENSDLAVIEAIQANFVWVVILLLAIGFQGKLFATFIRVEKAIADEFIHRTDNFMESGRKYREAVALTNMPNVVAPQIKQCEGKVMQEQMQCLNQAYKEGTKVLTAYRERFPGDPDWLQRWEKRLEQVKDYALSGEHNVLDVGATAFWAFASPQWEVIVTGLANGFAQMIFFVVDILVIIVSMSGPLAAAISLIPVSAWKKGFVTWQVGLLTLFGYKWALTLVNGVAADFVLNASADVNTLWFGIATGLALPLFLIVTAIFSASSLLNGLSSLAQKTASPTPAPSGGGGDGGGNPSAPPKGASAASQPELVR
jgi:hypothetical protein